MSGHHCYSQRPGRRSFLDWVALQLSMMLECSPVDCEDDLSCSSRAIRLGHPIFSSKPLQTLWLSAGGQPSYYTLKLNWPELNQTCFPLSHTRHLIHGSAISQILKIRGQRIQVKRVAYTILIYLLMLFTSWSCLLPPRMMKQWRTFIILWSCITWSTYVLCSFIRNLIIDYILCASFIMILFSIFASYRCRHTSSHIRMTILPSWKQKVNKILYTIYPQCK